MSTDWVEGYRSALARTLVRQGEVWVETNRWRQFDNSFDYKQTNAVQKHLAEDKTWTLDSDPTEEFWTEFAGTFASTDAGRRTGIKAKVGCSCGQFKDVVVVVASTSFSGLLMSMLTEEP